MSRYTTEGPFRTIREIDVENYDTGKTTKVIWETAGLRDNQGGYLYEQGTHRVRATGPDKASVKTKTFKGETAWSYAENAFHDGALAVRRAEHLDLV